MKKATLLLTLLSLTPLPQTLYAQDLMTSLTAWRMQEGDDARWAEAGFDDSSWTPNRTREGQNDDITVATVRRAE